jgi:hypothetical protein
MRRVLLVLVVAAVMLALVAASATAKQPKQYCAVLETNPDFTVCSNTPDKHLTKEQCESTVEALEQLNPGLTFSKCKKV